MAYTYYLQGNKTKAFYCLQQIKKNGTTSIDADKQAQRFAENEDWPNPLLLKVRLLIDGGYNKQALAYLKTKTSSDFTTYADKLEYYFRLGRVFDEMGNVNTALQYYNTTIKYGRNSKEYFAARAALQMAFIYEKAGMKPQAINSYNQCLSMEDHDFQNSIDQQAKAGLNRLQGR